MATALQVRISGAAGVQAKLRRLGAFAPIALARAINDIAEDVMHDAKDLTPVRDFGGGGVLRRSAFVELAQPTDRIRAVVGFGAVYAAPVHENPRAGRTHGVSPSGRRYKYWAKVGQWHFLEEPFVAASRTFRGDVGRRIQAEWRSFL